MNVPLTAWVKYIKVLRKVNDKATDLVRKYLETHQIPQTTEEMNALIDYAFAVSTKYGEASAAAAAEMYDSIAKASKVTVKPAEPAETPEISEVAKAVVGTAKTGNEEIISSAIGRLVKQTGVDTTIYNALRDSAEWAWIPSGDTCAFCLTLASRGWQRASKKALKKGHAEHIHANCDCTYAVRFDPDTDVEGYDPEALREEYDSAPGVNSRDKINSMRRDIYEKDKDKINARKRELYAERQRKVNEPNQGNVVDIKAIRSEDYRRKFRGMTESPKVDDAVCHQARQILKHRSGSSFEDLVLLDGDTGAVIHLLNNSDIENRVSYDDAIYNAINNAHKRGRRIVAVHNHPGNLPPSLDDGVSLLAHGYDIGIVVAHDGSVYKFTPTDIALSEEQCRQVHNNIAYQIETGGHIEDVWYNMLKEFGMIIERR